MTRGGVGLSRLYTEKGKIGRKLKVDVEGSLTLGLTVHVTVYEMIILD